MSYRDRRVAVLENEFLEIVVTVEGGHIAVVRDKETGVNPLWSPPWPTMEPSAYRPELHPEYGRDAESKLLSGLLGHNLCLDLFGDPSSDEAAAGMTVHGEASVVPYEIQVAGGTLTQRATLPQAGLSVERRIQLPAGSRCAIITETVENLSQLDRPIAWTQHVTLGPPFLERGVTQFRASATRAQVIDLDFVGRGHHLPGAGFTWPHVPCKDGTTEDLQVYTSRPSSAAFTTQLMDPERESAFWAAWHPGTGVAIAYLWRRTDFPWLGIWEENCCLPTPPWNGRTLARGMEFGASPFPESRRQMIERHRLFGVPTYRWIPARARLTAGYRIRLERTDSLEDLCISRLYAQNV